MSAENICDDYRSVQRTVCRSRSRNHQEISFNTTPSRIYAVLTDAALFQHLESFSDAMKSLDIRTHPARISRKPGGAFSLFADYIVGRQIELIPGRRIVQAWRVESWLPGAIRSRGSSSLRNAPEPRSASITPAFPPATQSTSQPAGTRTIGSRCIRC